MDLGHLESNDIEVLNDVEGVISFKIIDTNVTNGSINCMFDEFVTSK